MWSSLEIKEENEDVKKNKTRKESITSHLVPFRSLTHTYTHIHTMMNLDLHSYSRSPNP